MMGEYIEYVADGLLDSLHLPPYYGTLNPVSIRGWTATTSRYSANN